MKTIIDVDVCTIADIGISLTGEDAPAVIDTLNEYLSAFAKPVKREGGSSFAMGHFDCLNCGEPLGGMLGHFRWGMVHGEGTCSCGWPCRAYHWPKDSHGEIFDGPLEIILQYHPSNVDLKDKHSE